MDNMILRDRLMKAADVIMRVPPLFVIDELLRTGLGGGGEVQSFLANRTSKSSQMPYSIVTSIATVAPEPFLVQQKDFVDEYLYFNYIITTFGFLKYCIGILMSLSAFVLWTEHLMVLYTYLISVAIAYLSYQSNEHTLFKIINYTYSFNPRITILQDIISFNWNHLLTKGPGMHIIENYLIQSFFAYIFCRIHLGPRHPAIQKMIVVCFLTPCFLGLFSFERTFLVCAAAFTALAPLCLCKITFWFHIFSIKRVIDNGYRYATNFMSINGLSALFETEWTRLNVPNVLRTFWLLRVAEQVVQLMRAHYGDENFTLISLIRTLLINGCETLTALLGMTSIISSICHYIGYFFRWVLLTEEDEEKSIGTVSAILFYILALQTGLTSLDREKRLARLLRNFCLLSAAVLHFVHNIVNPVLMSLSASHNPALRRHLRALAVCTFLIVFPVSLLVFLWSNFDISTWLLAVSIFSVEVIVKVFVSLAIYSLFILDAYRNTFGEHFDDCVYVIKSFGNIVEFAFGVILLFNGIWILVYESGSAIRAIMMGIHAYFNIWSEAKAGWSVFMKRRMAVYKINSLPEAQQEQLSRLNDVCAICYQEMKCAKVTKCHHFFHGVCLRKWLYVQDRCPLCHDIIYKVEVNQEPENTNPPAAIETPQDNNNSQNESTDDSNSSSRDSPSLNDNGEPSDVER